MFLISRVNLSTTRLWWTDGQDNNFFCSSFELKSKLPLSMSGMVWTCGVNQAPSQNNQKCWHFPVYKLIAVGLGHPVAQHATLPSIHWDLCWATQPPRPTNRDYTLKSCPRELHLHSLWTVALRKTCSGAEGSSLVQKKDPSSAEAILASAALDTW